MPRVVPSDRFVPWLLPCGARSSGQAARTDAYAGGVRRGGVVHVDRPTAMQSPRHPSGTFERPTSRSLVGWRLTGGRDAERRAKVVGDTLLGTVDGIEVV